MQGGASYPHTTRATDGSTTRSVQHARWVRWVARAILDTCWRSVQITGFNHFIENLLPEIVAENSDLVLEQNGMWDAGAWGVLYGPRAVI